MESVFPFNILLPLLAVVLILGYWTFAFFILYHLLRFGVGVKPKIVGVIFILGSIVLFGLSIIFSFGLDFGVIFNNIGFLKFNAF